MEKYINLLVIPSTLMRIVNNTLRWQANSSESQFSLKCPSSSEEVINPPSAVASSTISRYLKLKHYPPLRMCARPRPFSSPQTNPNDIFLINRQPPGACWWYRFCPSDDSRSPCPGWHWPSPFSPTFNLCHSITGKSEAHTHVTETELTGVLQRPASPETRIVTCVSVHLQLDYYIHSSKSFTGLLNFNRPASAVQGEGSTDGWWQERGSNLLRQKRRLIFILATGMCHVLSRPFHL